MSPSILRTGAAVIALLLAPAGHAAPARSSTLPPPADSDWHYRIQSGDTLIALTAAYLQPGHHWRELQQLNRVANPLRLQPGSTLRMPLAWLAREAAVAEVIFVKGQVLLNREGGAEQALQTGMTLRSGDRLQSAAQASASLRFADGSRLLIPPESALSLEQLLVYGRSAIPAVQLRLMRGGADSQVRPNPGRLPLYEIRTPSANLGVRGTEFRVQVADEQHTRMAVLQGLVGASPAMSPGPDSKPRSEQRVAAGQGLLAAQGEPLQTRALPAAPVLGTQPTLQERLPLRFAWPGAVGVTAWRVQVFARQDFDRLLLDSLSREPSAQWPDLPDGDYTLRVRALDVSGLEGLASEHDFRLKARPEPPLLQAPAADARPYGERIELRWTLNTAARAYRLQLASDAEFKQMLQDLPALNGSSHTLSLPPGHYHWRIASLAADQGPFSDGQRFELRPLPPAPPPAEPQLDGDALQLRWSAQAGVARYELQMADDEGFTQQLQTWQSDKPAVSLPRPGHGRHFLRVRGLDADGQPGPWGQAQLIEVPWPRWPWLLPLLLLLH